MWFKISNVTESLSHQFNRMQEQFLMREWSDGFHIYLAGFNELEELVEYISGIWMTSGKDRARVEITNEASSCILSISIKIID